MLVRGNLGKRFFAGRRIIKGRRGRENGHAKGAHRATLLLVIRLRRMLTAIVRGGVLRHLGATARLDLRRRSPRGHRRQGERPGDRQANQKSRRDSHRQNNRPRPCRVKGHSSERRCAIERQKMATHREQSQSRSDKVLRNESIISNGRAQESAFPEEKASLGKRGAGDSRFDLLQRRRLGSIGSRPGPRSRPERSSSNRRSPLRRKNRGTVFARCVRDAHLLGQENVGDRFR